MGLVDMAKKAGFEAFDDDSRFGPCPKCGEYLLEIKSVGDRAQILYCGRQYNIDGATVICSFGAGTPALRAWMKRGWHVGLPIP